MNVGRLRATLLAPRALRVGCMLLPLVAVLAGGGFLVDDAFITARFAMNVHREGRHAFNAGGAIVDGVTPLVMPWLLAPVATSVVASVLVQS